MKKLLIILLVIFINKSVNAINEYNKGDKLYVIAKTGLNLRDQPDLKSKIIKKLLYGEELITEEEKLRYGRYEKDSVQIIKKGKCAKFQSISYSIKGKWVRVISEGIIGYVFDGYLSKNEPFYKDEKNRLEGIRGYIKRKYELQDSIVTKYEKSPEYQKTRLEYNAGCIVESGTTEKTGFGTIYLHNFSEEELMLYMKYWIEDMDSELCLIKADDKSRFYLFEGYIESIGLKFFGSLAIITFENWC